MACADLGEMGANMFDQQVGTCATLHPDFFNVAVTTCLLPSRSVESPFSVPWELLKQFSCPLRQFAEVGFQ